MTIRTVKFAAPSIMLLAATASCALAQQSPAPAPTPAQQDTPAQIEPATASAHGDGSNGPAQQVPSSLPGSPERASQQLALPGAVRSLMNFKDTDVKFDVAELMDILRDRRHEGWVLAAYPDPKTGRPLIGAGFSLDLPEREHPQRDPLNPHPFVEPSSAQLWQAAGLPQAKLDEILRAFDAKSAKLTKRKFRREIRQLPPEITDADADALLRVAIIQAAYNARAYCRNFDQLTPSQQMAMTQLVYQMGVNLAEFSDFLMLINSDGTVAADAEAARKPDAEYWRSVQLSLVHSQWARLYRDRAKAVIAMLDPKYLDDPAQAEHSVSAVLPPARRPKAGVRSATLSRRRAPAARKRAARTRKN
jgi:GH24 family phage-related lysozyme (muramidase)